MTTQHGRRSRRARANFKINLEAAEEGEDVEEGGVVREAAGAPATGMRCGVCQVFSHNYRQFQTFRRRSCKCSNHRTAICSYPLPPRNNLT